MTTNGVHAADYIQIMTQRIVERFHPLQVILFGSHARGEAGPLSDIDLLVVLPKVTDTRREEVAIRSVLSDLPVAKDIIVTTPEKIARRGNLVGTILRPALRDGKLLYDAEQRIGPGRIGQADELLTEGIRTVSDDDRLEETHRWLSLARDDLVTADLLASRSEVAPRQACFHAQQAAEKALKAVLVFLQIDFSKTHDLDGLRNLIPSGWAVKDEHPSLNDLSVWAIRGRYLGDWPEPTRQDARDAVSTARAVWDSVLRDLSAHGLDVSQHR